MKALVFDNSLKLVDMSIPEPEYGEALIKVSMAGICNTDLEITKGYMGFSGILGHEFVGIVEKINGNSQEWLGKRVVGEINCACGVCDLCKKGLNTHCSGRSVLGIHNKNGCFAEYITLPVKNLVEVPDNVKDEEAVFVEPLAAAFEITEQIHIKSTDRVLVLGDGKLGLLISLVLNLTQADVMLAGKHPEKLQIAEDQNVKTVLINELSNERSFDIVVDATGSISGFEMAMKLVRPRGVLVLKSTVAGGKELNLAPVVIDEISVIGSRCGPFKPAVKVLERKQLDVQPLISKLYDFDNALDAFEFSMTKGVLKVLLSLNA